MLLFEFDKAYKEFLFFVNSRMLKFLADVSFISGSILSPTLSY